VSQVLDLRWAASAPVLLALALASVAASCAASWLPLPWVLRPLVLVGAVVGRGLFASALAAGGGPLLPGMAALELVFLVAHRDALQRWAAAFLLPGWLVGEHGERAEWVLVPSLGIGVAVALTRRWWSGTLGASILAPLAGGLLTASLVLPSWPGEPWWWGLTASLGVTCAAVGLAVGWGAGIPLVDRLLIAVFPLALGALTFGVPGITVAVLVAGVGFLVRSPTVWGAAMVALVGYAVWFYYDLDLPLFQKGGAMIGLGLLCIAVGAWAGRRRSGVATGPRPVRDRSGAWLAGVGAVVAVALLAALAGRQEVRLAGSELVYLHLGPRDPRSLVQGDFQRLRYRVNGDLARTVGSGPSSGWVILQLDGDGVATFARADDGRTLAQTERRVRWTREKGQPTIASGAWLFEEGTGSTYDGARFGIVAVAADGGTLLVGLADEQRQRLGPPRRLW
jgi:uncharacterized membrane-anchored protein